jgi:hypothetical protein
MLAIAAAGCARDKLIETPVSCAECRIAVDRVATVGSADDSIGLGSMSRTTLGPGGYYVSPVSLPGAISRYDVNGRPMGQLGRVGDGPGEYRGPTYVFGTGDTVHVIDLAGARWTVLNAALDVVRTARVPFLGTQMTPLRDGRMAFYLSPQSGRDSTIPLHVVSADGSVKSFGSATRRGAVQNYQIAPALDGGIWLLDMFSYTVQKWSADGTLERTFAPARQWFPKTELPPLNRSVQDNVRDVRSYGTSIRESADGLWVVLSVANPKWRAPDNIPLDSNGFPEASVTKGKYSGMIELLDPATGALKAALRHKEPFKFMNDSLGYAFHATDDGEITHTIYRVSLSTRH